VSPAQRSGRRCAGLAVLSNDSFDPAAEAFCRGVKEHIPSDRDRGSDQCGWPGVSPEGYIREPEVVARFAAATTFSPAPVRQQTRSATHRPDGAGLPRQ
jgi:hypothetical protein